MKWNITTPEQKECKHANLDTDVIDMGDQGDGNGYIAHAIVFCEDCGAWRYGDL
jgi:hypothetical protein